MSNEKVRLGILGASWWTDVVYPGFALAENAEITWIAARTAAKAEARARDHGIPRWSASYEDVITASDVDAVFVGVPNFLHEEVATAALIAGKHVLQEKPMALSTAGALAQARLAREKGLVLAVNQEVRWADGVRDLPATIQGNIGAQRKLTVGLTLAPGEWGGWRGDPNLSGGTLFEMVIHELDLARWLWQRDPVAVTALGEDVAGRDVTVVLDFGAGDSAIVDVCWRSIGFRLTVACAGERGTLTREYEMPNGGGIETLSTESGRSTGPLATGIQGPATFRRMLERFASAVLHGSEPPVSAMDGVWAVRMAEAARESMLTGSRIDLAPLEL